MKRLFAVLITAMLVLSCASFAACAPKPRNLIRLSEVTHSIFYAPLYIAQNKGMFKDEGVTVEITNALGSDKVMTALTSGGADIGLLGPETTQYVYDQGKKDYPVIFGQLTKRDGSFLIGKVDEPNFKWENIKGKRVLAGRNGGMPAMALQYVVNQNGMTSPKDTNLDMDTAFDMMTAVFDSDKSVAYTTMFEPTASEFVAAGKGYIVASIGKDAGEVPYTAFSATKSYIKGHEDVVKKFLTAVVKGYRYMASASIDEVAAALQPSFKTTPIESIKYSIRSYLDIDAWSETPVLSEKSFKHMQDIMENAGKLTQRAGYSSTIDNTYASAVMEALK